MFDLEQVISFFFFPVDDTSEQDHVLHDENKGESTSGHGNDGSDSTKLGKHVSNVVILFGENLLSEIHSQEGLDFVANWIVVVAIFHHSRHQKQVVSILFQINFIRHIV